MTSLEMRPIAVLGAASSIGIRPYDGDCELRQLDRAPGVLRQHGLIERLGGSDERRVVDLGDIAPPPYRDYRRAPRTVRNEREVGDYNRLLAEHVARGMADDRFVVVLGGDCSIVLGSLLGAQRGGSHRVGLAYMDAHADFATPQESATGSAASMCLALAVGRGDSPLARLGDTGQPLVRTDDTVLVGRRDTVDANYGDAALHASAIVDMPDGFDLHPDVAAARILDRLARPELDGFWIHIDSDVLDPRVMFAVDSPEPGGPDFDQVAAVVSRLASHPQALGLQLTIYDPKLDPEHVCARRLVDMLATSLGGSATRGGQA